jgi:hypothetical protein
VNCESEILRKKYILCESNTVNDMKLMILEKIRVIRTSCSSTVGFTIFPYIVALVHTAPYVVLYHHYRRRTLAKVPRHSSFCPFFSQTGAIVRSRFLPSSTHHGRCRPGPLPPPMAGICPFRRNARVTPIMGDDVCSWFVVILAGRGKNTVLLPGRFEGFSP